MEHRGALTDTKKSRLDTLVEEGERNGEHELEDVEKTLGETVSKAENPNVHRSADRVARILDRMLDVFIDKDPLLTQQSLIVPIYWLTRQSSSTYLPQLRAFLIQFDRERKSNKDAKGLSGQRDVELDDFELMARTSNDAASIKGRYQVLRRRFEEFVGASV